MGPRVPESNGSSVASGACSIEDNDLEGAEKGNVNAKHDGNSRMPNQASIPAGFLESLKATPATKNPKATLQVSVPPFPNPDFIRFVQTVFSRIGISPKQSHAHTPHNTSNPSSRCL